MSNKDEIIQTILIHNGIYKRKVYLDSLAEGLEEYKMYSLMKIFPELFKPVFVSRELSYQDVIEKIVPVTFPENDSKVQTLVSTLFDYLSELSPNG